MKEKLKAHVHSMRQALGKLLQKASITTVLDAVTALAILFLLGVVLASIGVPLAIAYVPIRLGLLVFLVDFILVVTDDYLRKEIP